MAAIKDITVRDDQGRFPKGVSGNPAGRPRKSDIVDLKHAAEAAIREHVDIEDLKKIVNKMIKIAIGPPSKQQVAAGKLILESFLSKARESEEAPDASRTIVFKVQNALIETGQTPQDITVIPVITEEK